MTFISYVLLAMATRDAPGAAPETPRAADTIEFAQLTIRQRVIIRIPSRLPGPSAPPVEWREHRGPHCLPAVNLSGAAINRPDSVDLIVRGGERFRAELDDACPALDYYSGFYISPTADGQVCERRDSIRTRAGGECGIRRFRSLVPRR